MEAAAALCLLGLDVCFLLLNLVGAQHALRTRLAGCMHLVLEIREGSGRLLA